MGKRRKAAAGQGRPQHRRRLNNHRGPATRGNVQRVRDVDSGTDGQDSSELTEPQSQLAAALADLARGWYSVPIPAREKGPKVSGWQNLRLSEEELEEHFAGLGNRGLLLGEPSGGLVDVDLDATEAVALAVNFLPDTDRIHGRPGKPHSHWWYLAEMKTSQFRDVDGSMLVELRSTGGQTVVPPSTHPSGELLEWHAEGDPATVDAAELTHAVAMLAAASLLVRHYPVTGGRHDFALALAGALLRGDMDQDVVARFIESVAIQAGDEEVDDRVQAVSTTAEQLANGGEVTGLPSLQEAIGEEVVKRLAKWLGLRQPRRSAGLVEGQSLDDARTTVAAFQETVSAESAKSANWAGAVAEGLRCVQTVNALATLADQAKPEFVAVQLELQGVGVPVRITEGIESAVRHVLEERRREADLERPGEIDRYYATEGGLFWRKPCGDGAEFVHLTNFAARIVEDISEDDGAEIRRVFKIEAVFREEMRTFDVPAGKFEGMHWVTEQLGAQAIVYPKLQDHARTAIQSISDEVGRRTVYRHVGWTKRNNQWIFLHAGGGIGRHGQVDDVEVSVSGELGNYVLPEPPKGKELISCIRSVLKLIALAPLWLTLSLLAATFRAPLGIPFDATLFLTGRTGAGKSELVARFQQFFGAAMNREALPANWASTGNALEAMAFRAKDTLFCVDDFCPTGGQGEVAKYHGNADRLLRAQRNKAGRQRLAADGTSRPTKFPRCVLVGTGEDVPNGHSLRASMLVLSISPKDVDFTRLTEMQALGRDGVFAKVMAAYVMWLAPRLTKMQRAGKDKIDRWREKAAGSDLHRRTPAIVANLTLGLSSFLAFASHAGAITERRRVATLRQGWKALGEAAARQAEYHQAAEPERRFLELVSAALVSGEAHLAGYMGNAPHADVNAMPGDKGARKTATISLSHANGWRTTGSALQPQGKRIGWIGMDGEVFLDPVASYKAAMDMARLGEGISIASKTLHKRLNEAGLLATTESNRGKLTVRRTLEGVHRTVLHIRQLQHKGER